MKQDFMNILKASHCLPKPQVSFLINPANFNFFARFEAKKYVRFASGKSDL
jgi:hypothetical protein